MHRWAHLLGPEAEELLERVQRVGGGQAHQVEQQIRNGLSGQRVAELEVEGHADPFVPHRHAELVHAVVAEWLAEPDSDLGDDQRRRLGGLLAATAPIQEA